MKWLAGLLLTVTLVACGGAGSVGGDCDALVAAWEAAKVATQVVRTQAESPVSPGGGDITVAETKDIAEASDQQARARDTAVAAGCM
jgi:hypothetical protein